MNDSVPIRSLDTMNYTVRYSGTWMTLWDDRILEIIRQEGSGAPTELNNHEAIHVSRQHISRRLRILAEHGLLESLGNGVYIITDEGGAYLDGLYDAETEEFRDTEADHDLQTEDGKTKS